MGPQFGPLYRDARLRLRPRTPLEDMYLDVTDRGTRRAGRVPDGGRLQADRTRTPVHIGEVLDVFDAEVRPRVKAVIESTGRGLGDHGDDFRRALVRLAPLLRSAKRLTREFAIHHEQTRRLVHDYALLTGELARRDGQVTRLVRAGSETLGELGRVDKPLATLIDQMPPTLRQMPRTFNTVRATADELEPAFDALRPVARAMPAAYAALERLGPELRRGAAALRRPMPRLRRLVVAARPFATNLGSAFNHLRPTPPRLERVLGAVVPCKLAVQKFFQQTISVAKLYDALSVRPRGRLRAGTNTAGGAVADPGLTAGSSCAEGGPRK
jgi:ABC-type transporter Mla subunit MlaD